MYEWYEALADPSNPQEYQGVTSVALGSASFDLISQPAFGALSRECLRVARLEVVLLAAALAPAPALVVTIAAPVLHDVVDDYLHPLAIDGYVRSLDARCQRALAQRIPAPCLSYPTLGSEKGHARIEVPHVVGCTQDHKAAGHDAHPHTPAVSAHHYVMVRHSCFPEAL